MFRRAAADRDYWGEFVLEPALKFIASGEKRKGAPTGSLTGEIDVEPMVDIQMTLIPIIDKRAEEDARMDDLNGKIIKTFGLEDKT